MSFDASVARFLLVGVGNTLTGLVIIYLAKAFGISDMAANAMGYGAGLIQSFILNKRWTFRYDGPVLSKIIRFIVVIGLAYVANLAVVLGAIFILSINSYIAQALGIPVYTVVSYLGCRWYVFSDRIQILEQSS